MSEERKAKHTPGPWKLDGQDNYTGGFKIKTSQLNINFEAFKKNDANLIAAAPELLEALKEEHRQVVSEFSGNFAGHVSIREGWVEWDEDTRPEKCGICELIAKAEGGGSV